MASPRRRWCVGGQWGGGGRVHGGRGIGRGTGQRWWLWLSFGGVLWWQSFCALWPPGVAVDPGPGHPCSCTGPLCPTAGGLGPALRVPPPPGSSPRWASGRSATETDMHSNKTNGRRIPRRGQAPPPPPPPRPRPLPSHLKNVFYGANVLCVPWGHVRGVAWKGAWGAGGGHTGVGISRHGPQIARGCCQGLHQRAGQRGRARRVRGLLVRRGT